MSNPVEINHSSRSGPTYHNWSNAATWLIVHEILSVPGIQAFYEKWLKVLGDHRLEATDIHQFYIDYMCGMNGSTQLMFSEYKFVNWLELAGYLQDARDGIARVGPFKYITEESA